MNYTDQFGIVPVTDDMDLLFPENDMRRTRIGRVCFVLIRQGGRTGGNRRERRVAS